MSIGDSQRPSCLHYVRELANFYKINKIEPADSIKAQILLDGKLKYSQPDNLTKPYLFIGIFVNWRQLAAILLAFAIPYVLGLIMVLPNDMPLPSTRKVRGKLHNGVPIHSPQKLKTSSTEKFFDISEVKVKKFLKVSFIKCFTSPENPHTLKGRCRIYPCAAYSAWQFTK